MVRWRTLLHCARNVVECSNLSVSCTGGSSTSHMVSRIKNITKTLLSTSMIFDGCFLSASHHRPQSGRAVNEALRGRIAELERALAEAKAETEVVYHCNCIFSMVDLQAVLTPICPSKTTTDPDACLLRYSKYSVINIRSLSPFGLDPDPHNISQAVRAQKDAELTERLEAQANQMRRIFQVENAQRMMQLRFSQCV